VYIVDGIAYVGELRPPIKVCDVRYFNNFRLWTRFNTGEAKIFDFMPLLGTPAYAPLADKAFRERS
jgi:hypothetical protein